MSSKTKIIVLRMKEIIYTGIFLGLAVLLIALCLIMFRPKKDEETQAASYIPGVYTASLNLGSQDVNVQVAVDSNAITSISLVPLNEAVTTMYPLMEPALEELSDQIISTQSLENLTYSSQSHYTSTALLGAIERALEKAKI
ncbi:MAG: hypothetical protein KHX49_12295 [Lachnospiraceae bacterium]|uniref:FMN-binding domain-containing protein n=1 Tax=Candidatus Enterocloster excrementigallinarum TaxID=2838558 RepID=A0A9D2PWF9_9FIRM|nr:hypothetical protein [Lachnospiraceae bacterium]HJC66996.1 hypothetical protein [Candidatus Enterocloster excrementigallinarum]